LVYTEGMTNTEIPATIKITERVAIRWSAKPGMAGWGMLIGKTRSGRWAVANIGPIDGRPTYNVFALPADEAEARKVANREWAGMGL
jgi:hypothetical protein